MAFILHHNCYLIILRICLKTAHQDYIGGNFRMFELPGLIYISIVVILFIKTILSILFYI
jgi:hypothetical protein